MILYLDLISSTYFNPRLRLARAPRTVHYSNNLRQNLTLLQFISILRSKKSLLKFQLMSEHANHRMRLLG
jgi:hypothetical protein